MLIIEIGGILFFFFRWAAIIAWILELLVNGGCCWNFVVGRACETHSNREKQERWETMIGCGFYNKKTSSSSSFLPKRRRRHAISPHWPRWPLLPLCGVVTADRIAPFFLLSTQNISRTKHRKCASLLRSSHIKAFSSSSSPLTDKNGDDVIHQITQEEQFSSFFFCTHLSLKLHIWLKEVARQKVTKSHFNRTSRKTPAPLTKLKTESRHSIRPQWLKEEDKNGNFGSTRTRQSSF